MTETAYDHAAEEAAMRATLASQDAEKPQSSTDKPIDEQGASTQVPEENASPPALVAGLTEAQLKEILAKAARVDEIDAKYDQQVQKIFGKFGEINRALQQKQAPEAAPAAPAQQKIGAEKLKRIKEQYGDEMADALAEDLSDIVSMPAGLPDIEKTIADSVAREIARLETEAADKAADRQKSAMNKLDPQWMQKVNSSDFRLWLQTLLPDEAHQVLVCPDALDLHSSLQKFDGWVEANKKQQKNRERVAAAVTPQGTPASDAHTAADEDTAFHARLAQLAQRRS